MEEILKARNAIFSQGLFIECEPKREKILAS